MAVVEEGAVIVAARHLDHQADDPRVGAPEERHFSEEPPVHLQRELDAQRIGHLSDQLALLEQRQPERRPPVLVVPCVEEAVAAQ